MLWAAFDYWLGGVLLFFGICSAMDKKTPKKELPFHCGLAASGIALVVQATQISLAVQ